MRDFAQIDTSSESNESHQSWELYEKKDTPRVSMQIWLIRMLWYKHG